MRQSRSSFASANDDFATAPRNPMPYNFEGRARRQASMPRRLSRYVICANAMVRNCSVQRRLRTRTSPPYFATMRSKLVSGQRSRRCPRSEKSRKLPQNRHPKFKSTPNKIHPNPLLQKPYQLHLRRLTGRQCVEVPGGAGIVEGFVRGLVPAGFGIGFRADGIARQVGGALAIEDLAAAALALSRGRRRRPRAKLGAEGH